MAHYHIYFAGKQGSNDQHLQDAGLGILSRDGGTWWYDIEFGPDGTKGVACTWATKDNPEPDCDLRNKRWSQYGETGIYVGWNPDDPPFPDELRWRNRQVAGHWVTLGDGNEWMIPVPSSLPHYLSVDADGELSREVKAEHQSYLERAMELSSDIYDIFGLKDLMQDLPPEHRDKIPEDTPHLLKITDGLKLVMQGLQFNYRIAFPVSDALHLFDSHSAVEAFCAAIDLNHIQLTRQEKQKKKDSEGFAQIHVI